MSNDHGAAAVTGMEDVLAAHWSASTHTDRKPFVDKCDGCGEVILTWGGKGDSFSGSGPDRLAKHQAEALTAAGFGNLHDAWNAAVAAMVYEDGTPVEIAVNTNPYPSPKVSET